MGQPEEKSLLPKEKAWFVKDSDREFVLPLDQCTANCTGRGICIMNLDSERVSRCVCRKVGQRRERQRDC